MALHVSIPSPRISPIAKHCNLEAKEGIPSCCSYNGVLRRNRSSLLAKATAVDRKNCPAYPQSVSRRIKTVIAFLSPRIRVWLPILFGIFLVGITQEKLDAQETQPQEKVGVDWP